jgi:hypothetical protein
MAGKKLFVSDLRPPKMVGERTNTLFKRPLTIIIRHSAYFLDAGFPDQVRDRLARHDDAVFTKLSRNGEKQ